jgi:hypothetical protein
MPLLPREAAASWTLPSCPQKICVADDMTMMSMYTTTAGAASGVRSRSSSAAAAAMRRGHGSTPESNASRRPSTAAWSPVVRPIELLISR